jgi:hypothetical protein
MVLRAFTEREKRHRTLNSESGQTRVILSELDFAALVVTLQDRRHDSQLVF